MDLKKEVSQAVVFIENDVDLLPITVDQPKVLLPLVNRPILAYTLDMLFASQIEETFLFCDQHSEKIREFIEEYKRHRKIIIQVFSSEDYTNLGAVMRDLDSRGVIKSNFVLIGGGCVGNLRLDRLVEIHKKNMKNDSGCVMTCIFRPVSPKHRTRLSLAHQNTILVLDSRNKVSFLDNSHRKSIEIPMNLFDEDPQLSLHYDLLDTQIAICSEKVPPDFSDNFDFETRDNFIHGLLADRELLRQHIYVNILDGDYYAARVDNARSFGNISCDLLQRFIFPIVPDTEVGFSYRRNNVYLDIGVSFESKARSKMNVAIGRGTSIGKEAIIINTVIGPRCKIGENVLLINCQILSDTTIGDGCHFENCVIGPEVIIGDRCHLTNCLISKGVILSNDIHLIGTKLYYDPDGDETNVKLVGNDGRGYEYAAPIDSDDDNDDNDDGDGTGKENLDDESSEESASTKFSGSPDAGSLDSFGAGDDIHDEFSTFFHEVYDSFHRGIEEKTAAENIILEINSSKHAYNVPVKDVNTIVVKALLQISLNNCTKGNFFPTIKSNLLYAIPIIKNYIRTIEAQNDCLYAIEEFYLTNIDHKNGPITTVHFVKIIQFFYEKSVLDEDTILKWFHKPKILADHDIKEQEILRQSKEICLFIKWLEEAEEESEEE